LEVVADRHLPPRRRDVHPCANSPVELGAQNVGLRALELRSVSEMRPEPRLVEGELGPPRLHVAIVVRSTSAN
jgi:hypothetical protein